MNLSKSVKKFQKKIMKKGSWVHVAIVVSVVLLLVGVFWPRKKLGIRMVPVEGTTHFKAVLEHMDNPKSRPKYNKIDGKVFVFFKRKGCPYCEFINKKEKVWEQIKPGEDINIIKENKGIKFVVYDSTIPEDNDVIKKQNIKGYPTMRLYSNGFDPKVSNKKNFKEYKGGKNFDSIAIFLKENI